LIAAPHEPAEEDCRLARTPSWARRVLGLLFWTLLSGIFLWNALFLAWVGILKLACLMVGGAAICGVLGFILPSMR
jgi:hypothetical protein